MKKLLRKLLIKLRDKLYDQMMNDIDEPMTNEEIDKLINKVTMIDIKTLRIGCHVLYNGNRVKVEGIIKHKGIVFLENVRHDVYSNDLDPIPITEELLKELGFENGWQGTFDGYEITVTEQCEFGYSMDKYNVSIKNIMTSSHIAMVDGIKYLHELETFVYLTTKKELI